MTRSRKIVAAIAGLGIVMVLGCGGGDDEPSHENGSGCKAYQVGERSHNKDGQPVKCRKVGKNRYHWEFTSR